MPHTCVQNSALNACADVCHTVTECKTCFRSCQRNAVLQRFCQGLVLNDGDPMALHYRHTAASIARQLKQGRSLRSILLDRARGHVVSKHDPVTGGVHCSIGGTDADFLVTSTLASQGPPAVGRAMGVRLAHHLKKEAKKQHKDFDVPFARDAVSYVSVGDGSVNNAHMLSAVNMAEYASHRNFICPVVFGVTDNDICISLRGYKYLTEVWAEKLQMPCFQVDGSDMLDTWRGISTAVSLARRSSKPVAIIYTNVPRRFGHAVSDQQEEHSTREWIQESRERNPLSGACRQAVEAGYTTFPELAALARQVEQDTSAAFASAVSEAKLSSRTELLTRVSKPLVAMTTHTSTTDADNGTGRSKVMRYNMTQAIEETLRTYPNAVYIGEDVEHGGYYRITNGLKRKFDARIRDFPPDETSLLGIALGFAQCGLLPIVEMPYAKYLDCGWVGAHVHRFYRTTPCGAQTAGGVSTCV
eukprot:m.744725 g.744725  ORF g.744725 m.744725 type:complete len:472 (-) comp23124_c0_seq33:1502-2917(-)